MAKTQKINQSDFDFNKTTSVSDTNHVLEKLITLGVTIVFSIIFFNTHHTTSLQLNNVSAPQVNSAIKQQYSDYVVTAEDKKLFEDIFNYSTSTPVSTNSDVKFFNESVRKDDIKNADFVNKNTNEKVIITSKILSIDSPDKNQIMKESGFENLDYVDIVVEKTYKKGQEIYFEQQMVNVKMEKHKIITINTHRMID